MKDFYLFPQIASSVKQMRAALFAIAVIAFLPATLFGQAPTISYSSPQTYTQGSVITPLTPTATGVAAPTGAYGPAVVLGSGLTTGQSGMALDAAGNMYVADASGGIGVLKKITADGSSVTTIASGFSTAAAGVTVDKSGNVYFADQQNVWKIPASGSPVVYGTPVKIDEGSFTTPIGIAVDAAGNIYVADHASGAAKVYKMNSDGTNIQQIDTGLSGAYALALDASDNLYITDVITDAVYEIPADGSGQIRLQPGFGHPVAVAVDAAGYVYVQDIGLGVIFLVPPGGGSSTTLDLGFVVPISIAVDPAYNLYVGDLNHTVISKFSPAGGYFISPALPKGLSMDATTGTISGRPTAASVAADYLISAYNSSGQASATVNITVNAVPLPVISYSTPNTYTAGTAITPLAPTAGGVSAPGYTSPFSIGSGFTQPGAVAVDGAGNIYIADAGHGEIKKIPVGGFEVTFSTGYGYPTGVALDSLGHLYVADEAGSVFKMPVTDGSSPVAIGTGFFGPAALAADPVGNVYVMDNSAQALYKILASDGSTVPIAPTFFFDYLTAIALDGAGNLYVADGGASAVYKLSGGTGTPLAIPHIFTFPAGVAVDGTGIIYVIDGDDNVLYKIPANGGHKASIASGFNNAGAVVADGTGNLYIADTDNNAVEEISPVGGYFINHSLPAGLSLNSTTGTISGTATAASAATDYIITAYSAGGGGGAVLNIAVNLPPLPTISYNTPQTYTAGIAITPLLPTSTGVSGLGYSASFTNIGSVYTVPYGVAVDKAGNVYVADAGADKVEMIAPGGSPVSIGSGFSAPTGVAVDTSGYIYVADAFNGLVKKMPPGGGTPVIVSSGPSCGCGSGGFTFPVSVAVDPSGNVYVADEGDGNVYKIAGGSGSAAFFGPPFAQPVAVAADATGNVYVSDTGTGEVFKFAAKGGNPTHIGHTFDSAGGLAVDAAGNVFVSDAGGAVIKEFPANGGTAITISGAGIPSGIAIDGAGNLYAGDFADHTVKEFAPVGGYYINRPLPAGLSFNSVTGAISGTPAGPSAATDYKITGYNVAGGTLATVNITVVLPPLPSISYETPKVYTINAAIPALTPTGSGVGAPGFSVSPVGLGSGFDAPSGVAVDTAGNVYVADTHNNKVKMIPAAGGAPVILGTGATTLSSPYGVAVDAAGNIYIADYGHNKIKRIPPGGGAPTTIGSGFSNPTGIALDTAGNLYVADNGNNAIKKVLVNGTVSTLVSGLADPTGVAVDAAGNVYYTEFDINKVKKIPAGGGAPVTVGNFSSPFGVAVDKVGNVFVSGFDNNAVREIPKGGGASIVIGSGFNFPALIAVDLSGNVYVADGGNNIVEKIAPVGGYYINNSLPAGLNFDTGTGTISGTPTILSPATNYKVNAYNTGVSSSATVNIRISSNANLTSLNINEGTLSPVFAAGTTSYTASVGNGITSVKVTPKTKDAAATVKVNTITVVSGTQSQAIPLTVGANPIDVTVTGQDGTIKTYTVVITRAASTNATLAGLTIDNGTLSPGFLPGTNGYRDTISNTTTTVHVTPTTGNGHATVTVNGDPVTSGSSSSDIALPVGTTTIAVTVTAQDGTTTRTYTVTVTRRPQSTNATLAGLTISSGTLTPGFATGTSFYRDTVDNAIASVQITPTTTSANATIKVMGISVVSGTASGDIPLSIGDNFIPIEVTAQNGTTRTYSIKVVRPFVSSNARLAGLTINNGTLTPGFAPATTFYRDTVSTVTASVQVTPTTENASATIKVMGDPVVSGTASGDLPLSIGPNIIHIDVKAQDGTIKNYSIKVIRRVVSNNATLAGLTISSGTLTPGFAPGTSFYRDTVANGIAMVQVTPTTSSVFAAVKVMGNPVVSGTASADIPLSIGANTINVDVTAQDGTTRSYAIKVIRLSVSSNATLANLTMSGGTLIPVFAASKTSYHASVDNATATVQLTPTTNSASASVEVMGTPVASGTASGDITLAVGPNIITTVVTAQDGTTAKTYTLTVTRAAPGGVAGQQFAAFSAEGTRNDGVMVHQGVSPNGDAMNDILVIDGISAYPDNKLSIMSRNGDLVYEAKGYNNSSKIFDGHSSKSGKKQQPGTYFYSLEYKDGGVTKHKTGYIILKW